MTASLAFRKNEAAIIRGDAPAKYTRILPYIPSGNILELGSAEGVLALLLAKRGDRVTALEKSPDRHASALALSALWGVGAEFVCGDIASHVDLFEGKDTLIAVRMIYYLGDNLDRVFDEAAKHIRAIVLCGNRNRADRWRAGRPDAPLGEFNRYAAREGMRDLLERHGYRIAQEVTEGDEIVVGIMDRPPGDPLQDIADS